jgi:putative sigma-54 modulation protein
MSIPMTLTGDNVEVTPALREHAEKKFARLEKRGDHITHFNITLSIEKSRQIQIAKAVLHVKGAEIHASEEATDMYTAINGLVDKLKRQIEKHRDGRTDHH